MNQLIDLKLKKLVELCLETSNYKKLAVVGFTLISNRLDEIGIRLGIKSRNKTQGEKVYEYMTIINEILYNNFTLTLFQNQMLDNLRKIEILFLRKRGDLSLPFVKQIIGYYYDLRILDVPDVYQTYSKESLFDLPQLKAIPFLSGKSNKNSQGRLHPLILQKIREEERQVEMSLSTKFDSEMFEKAIRLKSIRKSIEKQHSGKITVHGALKDNINYITSKENIIRYMILGWLGLFLMLGVSIIYQSIIFPEISMGVSVYLLLFFASVGFITLLYHYYNKNGGADN